MSLRLDDVTLMTLYSVKDPRRGTLCVAEYDKHIPFDMKRVFTLYDLPDGVVRGQHAHRSQDQFLSCLNGRVEVRTTRENRDRTFILSQPSEGIYLPPMTWVEIKVLEVPALCLVIASGHYDESDYIRNFATFKTMHGKS